MTNIRHRGKRPVVALFCIIWAIGALGSLREIGKHIVHDAQPLNRRSVVHLSEDVGSQYMGMPESFFFKYIAKSPGTYGILERKIYDYMQEHHRKTWNPEFSIYRDKIRSLENPNVQ